MPWNKLWPNWHRLDVDPKILDETQKNLVLFSRPSHFRQTNPQKTKKTSDKSVTLVAFKLPSERMELRVYDITLAIWIHHGCSTYPPNLTPPRNKGFIAGLIKGNQWSKKALCLISGGGGGGYVRESRLTSHLNSRRFCSIWVEELFEPLHWRLQELERYPKNSISGRMTNRGNLKSTMFFSTLMYPPVI